MGVLDDLDRFCGYGLSGDNPYRFTQFWRTRGNCLRAEGGSGAGLSSNTAATSCHDSIDISVCFEDTAVLIGICVIFWLLAGLKFLVVTCSPTAKPLPFSRLHACKLLLVVLLMATGLCDLGYTVYQETSGDYGGTAQFLYFSPSTIVVTAVISLLVLWQERRDGVRSSALFTILWFSLLCYAILKCRSLILIAEDQGGAKDVFRFTTFCAQCGLYLLQMVLVLLPEPPPKGQLPDPAAKEPCPEESATFLSRITWWWLNGLIWRGWRKDLEYSDLTDLNTEDKSSVVTGNFQNSWDSEVHRTQRRGGGRQRVHPVSIQDDDEVRVVQSSGRRRRESGPSLVLALLKTFWPVFLSSAFFKLVQDLLNFVSPQVLKLLINFSEDEDEPKWKGYFYAMLLFVTAVIQSLFLHQYFHRCFTLGMRMRSALVAAIYKKALCLSNKSRREKTVGEIVNLMSVDAQRFMDLMTYIHLIWSAPLQIVLALLFLYFTMGVSIFAGFALMILLIPLNAAIAAKSRKYQVKQMAHKDSRIKLVNEILNGIKVIKLYAWEIPFQGQVQDTRQKELDVLKASAYLNAASSFSWTCAPFLVSLVTFGTYTLLNIHNPDNQLTPDKAFVALSLFNILRFPLAMLPFLISNLVQASVSVKRVGSFLRSEDLDPDIVDWSEEPASDKEYAVEVKNGTFTWSTTGEGGEGGEVGEAAGNREIGGPTLSDINLRIGGGQLVAVVGQVGAGKSSLISALLGEMEKLSGSISVKGKVAYIPQQAWIQNATIQNNILFGEPMQGLKYSETLHSCALEPDLEILPGQDQTEIGEKGINLSGGQKQRVSLARAVYQEADIYLLDDPLSAVDSHVGKHIFEKVIGPKGMIRNKTRILVTHGINYLSQCDQIVVMSGGRISEVGSYNELIDADGAFAEFIRVYSGVGEEEEEGAPSVSEYAEYDDGNLNLERSDSHGGLDPAVFSDNPEVRSRRKAHGEHVEKRRISESSVKEERKRHVSRSELKRQLSRQMSSDAGEKKAAAEPNDRSALIQQEKVETGSVHVSVLFAYIRACTYPLSLLTIVLYLLANGASLASNFWLADWSNSNIPANRNHTVTACDHFNSIAKRSGCYLGVYGAFGVIQSFMILFAAFSLALAAIFASRTLHNSMLKNILRSPMFFFDTTPLGRILNRFSKDTYIIDEVIPRSLRSFIFTFLTVVATLIVIVVTTPPFLVIILPLLIFYAMVQRFYVATSRQLKRLESTTRSPIYSHFQESITGATSIRAYRVQQRFILQSEEQVDYNQLAYYPSICSNRWLAIRLEFMGNLIILFAALFAVIQHNYQDEIKIRINAGLVGLSISYALQVTQSLNWAVRMTSEMETNIVAVERVKEYSETPQEAVAIISSNRPPPEWPANGHVRFDHYSTRYREGLSLVLRDITIDIPGGTKVGIVGRTGAGKSSLTLALFRIIEAATGSIKIDNVPISSYGLSDVRSRLTIIPQDPVLFSGSLRMNLDPFNKYGDTEVWRALESAHLKTFASSIPGGLQYMISEGGENLSVGQRQLVCLARALLRKTKILVLDEATAAVDLETDDLIQKTIRSEFSDCTILTIAHRLNTIIDYDYVMLLDSGRIVEYNPPNQLLGDKESSFYAMAKDANLV